MRPSALESRWLPVLLGILVADLNFWYWASTGENDADYLGIALFLLFGAWWLRGLLKRHSLRSGLAVLGAAAATALMILRETGAYDRGYIPPYAVFVAFALVSGLFAA